MHPKYLLNEKVFTDSLTQGATHKVRNFQGLVQFFVQLLVENVPKRFKYFFYKNW